MHLEKVDQGFLLRDVFLCMKLVMSREMCQNNGTGILRILDLSALALHCTCNSVHCNTRCNIKEHLTPDNDIEQGQCLKTFIFVPYVLRPFL